MSAGLGTNVGQYKQGSSKSLWNFALSPGWSKEEIDLLKIAIMKFGVGKWNDLVK